MKIRVMLVDDHTLIREGLRLLLEAVPAFEVVAECGTGGEALTLAARESPDVVVMDIAMPDMNGIEATREITARLPAVRVVMLSVHATSEHIFRALEAGAIAYVLKEAAGRELVDAIRSAANNRRYVSAKAQFLLDNSGNKTGRSPLDALSSRERQVLQLAVEGLSSVAIGQRLDLSPKTVETYRSRLMQKVGVRDITALVKFAVQHGLTTFG